MTFSVRRVVATWARPGAGLHDLDVGRPLYYNEGAVIGRAYIALGGSARWKRDESSPP
jgi:hypothetical protein